MDSAKFLFLDRGGLFIIEFESVGGIETFVPLFFGMEEFAVDIMYIVFQEMSEEGSDQGPAYSSISVSLFDIEVEMGSSSWPFRSFAASFDYQVFYISFTLRIIDSEQRLHYRF